MAWKRLALAVTAALCLASPAAAGVFTVTVPVGMSGGIFLMQPLPKYSGPETVRSVQLIFSGYTSTWQELYNFDEDPYLEPAMDFSWSVYLAGPGVFDNGGQTFADLGSFQVQTQFPATVVDHFVVLRVTPQIDFSISAFDPDLARYASPDPNDFNEFLLGYSSPFGEATGFWGTLTEVITTAVPEPSTWTILLLGFGLLGIAIRRVVATAPKPS